MLCYCRNAVIKQVPGYMHVSGGSHDRERTFPKALVLVTHASVCGGKRLNCVERNKNMHMHLKR